MVDYTCGDCGHKFQGMMPGLPAAPAECPKCRKRNLKFDKPKKR